MLQSIKLHLKITCKIGISVFTIYLPDRHEERYCATFKHVEYVLYECSL